MTALLCPPASLSSIPTNGSSRMAGGLQVCLRSCKKSPSLVPDSPLSAVVGLPHTLRPSVWLQFGCSGCCLRAGGGVWTGLTRCHFSSELYDLKKPERADNNNNNLEPPNIVFLFALCQLGRLEWHVDYTNNPNDYYYTIRHSTSFECILEP